ncbi:hypothetical protein B0H13DRAFT_2322892 [Mycena leptocephala]|nr:hypothetical protein B0H13DRAFT_2322892 [Mycena leptocephala]
MPPPSARPPHIPPSLLTAHCCPRRLTPATRAVFGTPPRLYVSHCRPSTTSSSWLQPSLSPPQDLSPHLRIVPYSGVLPKFSACPTLLPPHTRAVIRHLRCTLAMTRAVSCRTHPAHPPFSDPLATQSRPAPPVSARGLLLPANLGCCVVAFGELPHPPRLYLLPTAHPGIVLGVRTTSRSFALRFPKSPHSTPFRAAVSDWASTTPHVPHPLAAAAILILVAANGKFNKDKRKVTHLWLSPQRRRRALPPSETTRKRDGAFGGTRRSPPVLAVSAHKLVWKGKTNCRHSWLPLIPPHPRLETPLPTRLAGSRLPRVQNVGVTSHDKVRERTRDRSKGWDGTTGGSANQHFDRPSRHRPLPRNVLQTHSTHLSTALRMRPNSTRHLPSSAPGVFVTYSALAHTSPFTRAIGGAAPPLLGGILP